jgi:hypothetical protein
VKPFFPPSRQFAQGLSMLFDFVHPAAAALWNLRWQVRGYVATVPTVSEVALSARFGAGISGVRADNLRRVCIEHSWDQQLGEFAKVVLFNVIALYEGWAEDIARMAGSPSESKGLQFPSRGTYGNTRRGIGETIDILLTSQSPTMSLCFFPVYSGSAKYSGRQLDAMAALYRYHKEVRNSLAHRGGIANAATAAAYDEIKELRRTDVGSRANVNLAPIIDGQPVEISFFSVIQLADVINRMVITADARLTCSKVAEDYLLGLWRSSKHTNRTLPSNQDVRQHKIGAMCKKLGFAEPIEPEALDRLLRDNKLGL